ncbi:MAG: s-methyl-5-thioribose-1-phosphate isomerase, partial [Gemmatimonadetes bacterium]|nr:s-methyl-5-thioribose-1-phosphate isomerase [Gemmatimonadota bacterium]
CNAGALATAGIGTALAPLYTAWDAGKRFEVFADETRPLWQGARLTAWELAQAGIPVKVLCDGAAASLLASGQVKLVIVGADRVAANGDVANKIGTYGVALAARAHDIPFYVAAPSSTFDLGTPTGAGIPIEQRTSGEIVEPMGSPMAPEGVEGWNPAFDITPNALIAGFVTESGILRPPFVESIRTAFGRGGGGA